MDVDEGGILPVLEESEETFAAGLLRRVVMPSRLPWPLTLERAPRRSVRLTSTLDRRCTSELAS